jgi:hypothetical protein
MAHDAIGAHARDELGISEIFRARPIQAALASAGRRAGSPVGISIRFGPAETKLGSPKFQFGRACRLFTTCVTLGTPVATFSARARCDRSVVN